MTTASRITWQNLDSGTEIWVWTHLGPPGRPVGHRHRSVCHVRCAWVVASCVSRSGGVQGPPHGPRATTQAPHKPPHHRHLPPEALHQHSTGREVGIGGNRGFQIFSDFHNFILAHKSSWKLLPSKNNLSLDSFAVATDRLVGTEC